MSKKKSDEIILNPAQTQDSSIQPILNNSVSNVDISLTNDIDTSSENKIQSLDTTFSDYNNLNRIRKTTFQSRLSRYSDNIARRVLDNRIRLTGNAMDMLRIEVKRDTRSHDAISHKLTKAEVVPIIMKQLKDIPLRQLLKDGTTVKVPSLYVINEDTYFECFAPNIFNLNIDDYLVKIYFKDDLSTETDYCVIFKVSEQLGTFGNSSLLYRKYWLTLADEEIKIPQSILTFIKNSKIKREVLNF